MGDPKTYFFDLSNQQRPAKFKAAEVIYDKIDWFNANRSSSRIFDAVNGIEAVVIHATAGGTTSGALSHWETPGVQASAHWIVPGEQEANHGKAALAVVYEARAAWHVRNSATSPKIGNRVRINHWSLGIEIVNKQDNQDTFSDWQVRSTAQLVRYCWAKYPNFRYVFSHAVVDPDRRSDPGSIFDWETFKGHVLDPGNVP